MSLRPHVVFWLIWSLCAGAACSRGSSSREGAEGDSAGRSAQGNDAAIRNVLAGARALAQPGAAVDYVAAEMEGVIKARTQSQVLMYYEGYRVTMTTPSDRVTQITFDLVEAKPTIEQLDQALGTPKPVRKGMLYEYDSATTKAKILILAEPVSMPAEAGSLVRRIVIEGAPTR